MRIPIAIVEDNASLRKRLAENLTFFTEVEVVLAAPTGEQFLEALKNLTPDRKPRVVLMDIELPGITGIETTRRLKVDFPEVDVLILTVFEDSTRLFESVEAGATGYLLKDEPTPSIVQAVQELVAGGAPMSGIMARKMLQYFKRPDVIPRAQPVPAATPDLLKQPAEASDSNVYDLTDREVIILERLVAGDNYLQIGEKLFISPQTVKSHIKNIYRKMHVHSRADAVREALKNNVVKG